MPRAFGQAATRAQPVGVSLFAVLGLDALSLSAANGTRCLTRARLAHTAYLAMPRMPRERYPGAGRIVQERLLGRVERFTRNARGGGNGRLRYVRKFEDGTRTVGSVDFSHGQCVGEDELPLEAGVYPRLGQPVGFYLHRGRNGRSYAADVTGKDGGPLLTVGTPLAQDDEEEGDHVPELDDDMDFELEEDAPAPAPTQPQLAEGGPAKPQLAEGNPAMPQLAEGGPAQPQRAVNASA